MVNGGYVRLMVVIFQLMMVIFELMVVIFRIMFVIFRLMLVIFQTMEVITHWSRYLKIRTVFVQIEITSRQNATSFSHYNWSLRNWHYGPKP